MNRIADFFLFALAVSLPIWALLYAMIIAQSSLVFKRKIVIYISVIWLMQHGRRFVKP